MADANDVHDADMPSGDGNDKFAAVFQDDRFKRIEATCQRLDAILPKLEEALGSEEEGQEGADGQVDPNAAGTENDLDMSGGEGGDDGQDDLLGSGADYHDGGHAATDDGSDTDTDPTAAPPVKNAACPPDEPNCDTTRMSMGAAGPVDAFVPGSAKNKKEPTRMSATQTKAVKDAIDRQVAVKFSKMEQELALVKQANTLLMEEREAAVVQSLLAGLDAEGYVYDPEIELPALVRMSKEDRQKRLDYIRKVHQRAERVPGAGRFPVPSESQATVRFSKATQPKADSPTEFNSQEEAVQCAIEAAGKGISAKDVLAKKRGVATGSTVTAVR